MIQVTVSIWFKSFNYLKILLNVYFRYGPCQTPTLGFCVQRYMHINTFKPEKFWALRPYIRKDGYELQLEWERRRLFDLEAATVFQKLVVEGRTAKVMDVSEKQEVKGRPAGLNTVNLLKVASSALGFGPQTAMHLAERLYTQGFIRFDCSILQIIIFVI